jgi:DNA-binding IclR family transcriptional regulator
VGIAALEDWFRVERAVLSHPAGATLADLAEITGMPKPTLLRYLSTGLEWQRVEKDDSGRWRTTKSWTLNHLHAYAHREEAHASA